MAEADEAINLEHNEPGINGCAKNALQLGATQCTSLHRGGWLDEWKMVLKDCPAFVPSAKDS